MYVQTESSLLIKLNKILDSLSFSGLLIKCFENYRLSVISGNTKINQVIDGPQNWHFPN